MLYLARLQGPLKRCTCDEDRWNQNDLSALRLLSPLKYLWTFRKRKPAFLDAENMRRKGKLCGCLSFSPSINTVISPPANEVKVVMGWKLVLLTTQQPISQVTRNWGKERNFIQKSSKPRRWQTSTPKKPPWERRNSGFFYVRVRGFEARGGWWLQTSGCQQGPRGDGETSNNGCCGLSKRFLQISW